MHELQRRTALACVVCDRGARQSFARQEQLLHHVEAAHGQRLCHFCLQVRVHAWGLGGWGLVGGMSTGEMCGSKQGCLCATVWVGLGRGVCMKAAGSV